MVREGRFIIRDATLLGLCSFIRLDPRVAARRGNPGADLHNRFAVGMTYT